MMEFHGTFRLDGQPRFEFAVSGFLHQTDASPGLREPIEGGLVLTVTRVPYFPGPIESGQSGRLQISGFEDLPISLNSVDLPRMDLRSKDLELSVRFTSREPLNERRADVVLGIFSGSEREPMSLFQQASELSRRTG